MKSCNRNKMTQKTILLGAAILMACSLGKSEGFFLNRLLEATTPENPISVTSSPDNSIAYNNQTRFDELHRNVFEESSTQIVNSVKDILSLVLDDHSSDNQTAEEYKKNQVITDTDSDNDIPSPEALVKNLKLDSDDPPLSIVQIPESDNEDVATALEDSIRSSVKDEIQLEQSFDTSAIDNIPDPDVRQTLTEEMMAIDYPQGVKKSDESNDESKQTVANEEEKIELKSAPIAVPTEVIVSHLTQVPNTTASPITTSTSSTTPVISTTIVATTTSIPTTPLTSTTTAIPTTTPAPKVEIFDIIDTVGVTTVPELETIVLTNANVTTPTIEIFQEITLIPTQEIVHDVMEPQDTLEANPTLTRQMRGFSEESDTNEISSETLDSTDKEESSKNKSDSSNPSENSSVSSDSSSKESSVLDENVAAEESDEEHDAAISHDASIEDNFEKETPIAAEFVSSKRVTPTPRPAISSTTDVTVVPIEIDGITESSGELLTEATVTSGDGKHIVMKKPGVEEEFSWSNSTGKSILQTAEVPSGETGQNEPPAAETRTAVDPVVDYVHNAADSQVHLKVTETSITANISTIVDTLSEDSLVVEKNLLNADSDTKPIDLEPLNVGSENVPPSLKDGLDNKTQQPAETVANVDQISIQTHIPEVHTNNSLEGETFVPLVDQKKREDIDELEHKHSSEIEPTTGHHDKTLKPNLFSQVPSTEYLQRTLNVEPASIAEMGTEESSEPISLGHQLDTDDRLSAAIPPPQHETEHQLDSVIAGSTPEISSIMPPSASQTPLDSKDVQTSSVETSTELPTIFIHGPSFPLKEGNTDADIDATSKINEISKHIDESAPNHSLEHSSTPKPFEEELESITYESSTEKPIGRSNSNDDATTPALVKTLIEAAELTTEFARHVDSFRTSREETSAISDEIVSPASSGRSFNTIIAEGLGKALPTRSVGDEPSTSSYSSEDKTTTVVVLCSAAALIFVAFSIAMYLITFQRQHGTLDIEMQEQHCGKDDLEDDDDAETRVTLLNQSPPVDSDEHSFD